MRSTWRRRVVTAVAAAAFVVPAVALRAEPVDLEPAPAPPASLPSPWKYGPEDLVLQKRTQINERTIDLTFTTPALAAPTTARVVLPVGYDPAAATRYPTLVLLHGGAGQYTNWYDNGVPAITQDLSLITVLPDAGRSAWYTDWYNNGAGGPPMWETYHLGQLIPWIDQNFKTIGTRAGRAIAGLSSGGFGTLSYAARHPDMFAAAAGFSAAADTNTRPVVSAKVIDALALQDRGGPGSMFGLRETQEVRWRGRNPWDLAENLRATSVTLRTGNGDAGGKFGGGGPTDPVGMVLERSCYEQSLSFHNRLDELGIGHVWDYYGAGTHSGPYWQDSLIKTMPDFMRVFAEQRPDPTEFTYRSIESNFEVFDWQVLMERPVVEFAELDVTTGGFTLSGSGGAQVLTAALYEPGVMYEVETVSSDGSAETAGLQAADAAGRLLIDVDLGPGNLDQQRFTPTHESPLTKVYETAVTISAA